MAHEDHGPAGLLKAADLLETPSLEFAVHHREDFIVVGFTKQAVARDQGLAVEASADLARAMKLAFRVLVAEQQRAEVERCAAA